MLGTLLTIMSRYSGEMPGRIARLRSNIWRARIVDNLLSGFCPDNAVVSNHAADASRRRRITLRRSDPQHGVATRSSGTGGSLFTWWKT